MPTTTKRFKQKTLNAIVHTCCYSLLLTQNTLLAIAAPAGGEVVGGNGSITQTGTTTTINQSTQNMAINWQSYNLNANEQVQYIQPNAASISLNNILSNNGSVIAGRINANGQVILVNPNGIFFTPTSVINVGGIIASGLTINPTDFMNGNYVFNEAIGSEGAVLNSGIINAATGGNVALIGKQVENNGLIVANLGSVTLAAGKEAVLTFDNQGLLGVKVTNAILQEELGLDPAVINSGNIQAQGGKVLLTATQSQDVFSRAVNTTGLEQATSVVVNADGSFTLGGADVLNSGSIDTSTTSAEQTPGRIALIGNNVTSSGSLKADAATGNGGEIELHANDMTLLTEDSVTSARSESNGNGGIVKVLGDKVGVFDRSVIDVSGANGGGRALIGGDFQGKNASIRNATVTFVDRNANIYADALENGNGGRVILWADDTTKFLGNIFARGGSIAGDGGFVETSGKRSLLFDGVADRTAVNGSNGTLLLDPRNIRVSDNANASDGQDNNNLLPNSGTTTPTIAFATSAGSDVTITNARLRQSLALGTVELQATRDINIDGPVDVSGNTQNGTPDNPTNNNLVLRAGDDINISNSVNLNGGNLTMIAGVANCTGTTCLPGDPPSPNVTINGTIDTAGAITINSAEQVTINRAIGGGATAPASVTIRAGGGIRVDTSGSNSGSITANGNVSLTAADTTLSSGPAPITIAATSPASLNIEIQGDITTNGGNFSASTATGYFDNWFDNGRRINTGNGTVTIATGGGAESPSRFFGGAFLGGITTTRTGALSVTTTGGGITQSPLDNLSIAGTASFNANAYPINLPNNANRIGGAITLGPTTGTGGSVVLNNAIGTTLGTARATTLAVNASQNLTLTGPIATSGITDLNFGTGGASTFTIDPGLALTTGTLTIDGGAGGDTFRIGSSIPGTVSGNNGGDTFVITATGVSVTALNGGAGIDTLTGNNEANTWSINSANAGSLNTTNGPVTYAIAFSNIENLTGNAAADTFNYAAGSSISGVVNGAGGADQVNQSTMAANITLGDGRYTNIETFVGNGVGSTMTGNNTVNAWNINGSNAGIVNDGTADTAFIGFNILNGGSATDTFTLAAGGSVTSIDGKGGTDTLVGQDVGSTWSVGATDAGSVSWSTATTLFSDIENLTGGTDLDAFTLTAGSISGLIDGAGGADTLLTRNGVTVELGNRVTANLNVYRVETITGGTGGSTNTLIGDNAVNTWTVTGANSGTVNDGMNPTTTFNNFSAIEGGNLADQFVVNGGASIATASGGAGNDSFTLNGRATTINGGDDNDTVSVNAGAQVGTINLGAGNDEFFYNAGAVIAVNGGIGNDTFTLASANDTITLNGGDGTDYAGYVGAVDITVGTTASELEGVTAINGNGTLNARANVTTAWTIDSRNGGRLVDSSGQSLAFTGFSILNGGNGDDNFVIARDTVNNTNGQVTGAINGMGGTNALLVNLTGSEFGQVNYVGTTGNDAITIAGNTGTYNGSYTPSTATDPADQLVYTGTNGTYTVNYTNADTVQSNRTLNTLTVNGSADADTIALGANNFAVGGRTQVGYTDVANLSVNGQAGADTVALNAVNIPGSLTLTAERITGTGMQTANTLILDNVGEFGSAGAQIATSLNNLQLLNAGAVYLNEANGLNLNTSGNVTNTGQFTIAGLTTLNTGNGGSLTLNNTRNDFDTVATAAGINAASINLTDRDEINGGLTAAAIVLNTVSGVGTMGAFNTDTARLTVTNTGGNTVNIANTGTVTVGITNQGDIDLVNQGDIIIDRLYTNGGNHAISGPYNGDVSVAAINGSIQAYQGSPAYSDLTPQLATDRPDIVAQNLDMRADAGAGNFVRPLSVRVNDRFFYVGGQGYIYYYGNRPANPLGVSDLVVFSSLDALSNQQLIEIESLGDFDPAIFTAVRNYYHEDVAIMMPMDQRFDAPDDDEKEKGAEQPK